MDLHTRAALLQGNMASTCCALMLRTHSFYDISLLQGLAACLTELWLQGVKDSDAAEKALQDEALLSAALPSSQNIMRPLALVWKDTTRQKLIGIVYPWMKGGDLLTFLK